MKLTLFHISSENNEISESGIKAIEETVLDEMLSQLRITLSKNGYYPKMSILIAF